MLARHVFPHLTFLLSHMYAIYCMDPCVLTANQYMGIESSRLVQKLLAAKTAAAEVARGSLPLHGHVRQPAGYLASLK